MSYWKGGGEGGRGDVDEGKVLYTRLGNTAAHTYTTDVCMCDSVIGYSTVHVYMLGVCMRVGALCKDITSKKLMKA